MSWFWRIVVFVPAVYLVMVVYCAPLAPTARGVMDVAARKTVKVLAWTVVLVVVMLVLEWLFLPQGEVPITD